MKLDLRYRCVVGLTTLGILALGSAADAQTRKRRPQQVAPTGAEDAPAGRADTAAQRQERQRERELEAMTSRSDQGLRIVRHLNGTETVHLQGRFMSVAVITPEEGGGESVTCQAGPAAVVKARSTQARPASARPKAKKAAVPEEK